MCGVLHVINPSAEEEGGGEAGGAKDGVDGDGDVIVERGVVEQRRDEEDGRDAHVEVEGDDARSETERPLPVTEAETEGDMGERGGV